MYLNAIVGLSAFVALAEARPFLVDEASRMGVSAMVEYRQTGVGRVQAHSMAEKMIGDLVDSPPFATLIANGMNALAQNGGSHLKDDQVLSLAKEYVTAFSQFSSGKDYSPYTSYFKANIKNFKADEVVDLGIQLAGANKEAIKSAHDKAQANPALRDALAQVTPVAHKFAQDLGLDKYADKAWAAKQQVL